MGKRLYRHMKKPEDGHVQLATLELTLLEAQLNTKIAASLGSSGGRTMYGGGWDDLIDFPMARAWPAKKPPATVEQPGEPLPLDRLDSTAAPDLGKGKALPAAESNSMFKQQARPASAIGTIPPSVARQSASRPRTSSTTPATEGRGKRRQHQREQRQDQDPHQQKRLRESSPPSKMRVRDSLSRGASTSSSATRAWSPSADEFTATSGAGSSARKASTVDSVASRDRELEHVRIPEALPFATSNSLSPTYDSVAGGAGHTEGLRRGSGMRNRRGGEVSAGNLMHTTPTRHNYQHHLHQLQPQQGMYTGFRNEQPEWIADAQRARLSPTLLADLGYETGCGDGSGHGVRDSRKNVDEGHEDLDDFTVSGLESAAVFNASGTSSPYALGMFKPGWQQQQQQLKDTGNEFAVDIHRDVDGDDIKSEDGAFVPRAALPLPLSSRHPSMSASHHPASEPSRRDVSGREERECDSCDSLGAMIPAQVSDGGRTPLGVFGLEFSAASSRRRDEGVSVHGDHSPHEAGTGSLQSSSVRGGDGSGSGRGGNYLYDYIRSSDAHAGPPQPGVGETSSNSARAQKSGRDDRADLQHDVSHRRSTPLRALQAAFSYSRAVISRQDRDVDTCQGSYGLDTTASLAAWREPDEVVATSRAAAAATGTTTPQHRRLRETTALRGMSSDTMGASTAIVGAVINAPGEASQDEIASAVMKVDFEWKEVRASYFVEGLLCRLFSHISQSSRQAFTLYVVSVFCR